MWTYIVNIVSVLHVALYLGQLTKRTIVRFANKSSLAADTYGCQCRKCLTWLIMLYTSVFSSLRLRYAHEPFYIQSLPRICAHLPSHFPAWSIFWTHRAEINRSLPGKPLLRGFLRRSWRYHLISPKNDEWVDISARRVFAFVLFRGVGKEGGAEISNDLLTLDPERVTQDWLKKVLPETPRSRTQYPQSRCLHCCSKCFQRNYSCCYSRGV